MQNQCIRQGIFLYQVSCYDGFVNLFDVICPVFFRSVSIRTRQTAFDGILIKQFILILNIFVVPAIFPEAKREYMNFDVTPRKKRR